MQIRLSRYFQKIIKASRSSVYRVNVTTYHVRTPHHTITTQPSHHLSAARKTGNTTLYSLLLRTTHTVVSDEIYHNKRNLATQAGGEQATSVDQSAKGRIPGRTLAVPGRRSLADDAVALRGLVVTGARRVCGRAPGRSVSPGETQRHATRRNETHAWRRGCV